MRRAFLRADFANDRRANGWNKNCKKNIGEANEICVQPIRGTDNICICP